MTIKDIITSVAAVAGSYSEPSFHRDRKRLKIKPAAIRQIPQQYPGDTAERILKARGFNPALSLMATFPPLNTAASALENIRRADKLVSPVALKAEKRKGKATR